MNASSSLSPNAQATLLLTSYFSKVSSETAKPLSNTEWGRFAAWLIENSHTPADLLKTDPGTVLGSWHDSRIGTERIVSLLNRGHSLALAMEKWQRVGLWIVTRSDREYPARLKSHLGTACPPVLFGCGNKSFLNAGGLAVIGSRNASASDLAFTKQVGTKAAYECVAIVSGGTRGVDETAMLSAMEQKGIVIGVMADSLLKAATSSKWRKGLMNDHTMLVSPFYPEAGFSPGSAMARNRYIYCLADSSLVIHSGKKGGTFNGARENLKRGWVPLWVKRTDDRNAANADLVADGGRWLEADVSRFSVADLLKPETTVADRVNEKQVDLFAATSEPELPTAPEAKFDRASEPGDVATEPTPAETNTATPSDKSLALSEPTEAVQAETAGTVDFYRLFTTEMHNLAREPVTVDELIKITQLHKSQLNEWLKRAVEDGVVRKLNRPVRYQVGKGD